MELRCLKWARMTHLDTSNISYGQKKGRESNWQFDSRPLKVRNHPDLLACRWAATYRWKALDEGYNFALDLISIEVFHTKLWAPKLRESQPWEFQDSHLGVSGQNDIWVLVPWPCTKYTIRGRMVISSKSGPWWVLWVQVCSWFVLAPKVLQLCTNQLVVWFVQVRVSDWLLVIHPSFIPELQHAPLSPKSCKPGGVLQLLTLPLFSLQTHTWIYQGAWEHVTFHLEVHVWFAQSETIEDRYHPPKDSIKSGHWNSFWTSNHYLLYLTCL